MKLFEFLVHGVPVTVLEFDKNEFSQRRDGDRLVQGGVQRRDRLPPGAWPRESFGLSRQAQPSATGVVRSEARLRSPRTRLSALAR
jgi:hypothetical protein